MLSRLVFYAAMLVVLQLAFGVFGPNPISDLLSRVLAFLPRIVVAVIVIVVASVVGRAVRDVIGTLIGWLPYGRALATAANVLVVGIGVFAALDQLEIAPTVVTGVFYAVLAIVVGVTVVAVGGGGIVPLRQRWERGLTRMEHEAVQIRDEAQRQREAEEQAQREAEEQAQVIRSTPPDEVLSPPSLAEASTSDGHSDAEVTLDPDLTTVEIARPVPAESELALDPDDPDALTDPTSTTMRIDTGRTTTQLARPDDDGPRRASRRRRRSRRKPPPDDERLL
jgi:hypothetical protein